MSVLLGFIVFAACVATQGQGNTVMYVASTSFDVVIPYTSGLYHRSEQCYNCHPGSLSCLCSFVPQRIPKLTVGRSYNLVKLETIDENIHIIFSRSYDLYADQDNVVHLANELNTCGTGTLVILFSHDDASTNYKHPKLQDAMKRCQANNVFTNTEFNFELRSSYIFLGICGDDANDPAVQNNYEFYHPDAQIVVQFSMKEGKVDSVVAGSGKDWFLPLHTEGALPWSHDCLRHGHKLLVAIAHYGLGNIGVGGQQYNSHRVTYMLSQVIQNLEEIQRNGINVNVHIHICIDPDALPKEYDFIKMSALQIQFIFHHPDVRYTLQGMYRDTFYIEAHKDKYDFFLFQEDDWNVTHVALNNLCIEWSRLRGTNYYPILLPYERVEPSIPGDFEQTIITSMNSRSLPHLKDVVEHEGLRYIIPSNPYNGILFYPRDEYLNTLYRYEILWGMKFSNTANLHLDSEYLHSLWANHILQGVVPVHNFSHFFLRHLDTKYANAPIKVKGKQGEVVTAAEFLDLVRRRIAEKWRDDEDATNFTSNNDAFC